MPLFGGVYCIRKRVSIMLDNEGFQNAPTYIEAAKHAEDDPAWRTAGDKPPTPEEDRRTYETLRAYRQSHALDVVVSLEPSPEE